MKDSSQSPELVQRDLKICSLEDQLASTQAQIFTDKLALQAENSNLKNQLDEWINKFIQIDGSKDQLTREVEDAKEIFRQDAKAKEVGKLTAFKPRCEVYFQFFRTEQKKHQIDPNY